MRSGDSKLEVRDNVAGGDIHNEVHNHHYYVGHNEPTEMARFPSPPFGRPVQPNPKINHFDSQSGSLVLVMCPQQEQEARKFQYEHKPAIEKVFRDTWPNFTASFVNRPDGALQIVNVQTGVGRLTAQVSADGFVGLRVTDEMHLGTDLVIERCLEIIGHFGTVACKILAMLQAHEPLYFKIHLGPGMRVTKNGLERPIAYGDQLSPLASDLPTLAIPADSTNGIAVDAHSCDVVKLDEISHGLHSRLLEDWLMKVLTGAQLWPKTEELRELLRRWMQRL